MKAEMSNQRAVRNNSIDLIRYFCALLVVTIHTSPFQESCYGAYYVLTQFVARMSVPFFFSVSGYFFFQKLKKGKLNYAAYLFGLIRKYAVWSCIYFGILFADGGYLDISQFVKTSVLNFLIYGSYYHFWFFPALIFSSFAALLMYKAGFRKRMVLLSVMLFVFGCMGCAYSGLFHDFPELGTYFASEHFRLLRRIVLTGVPFFVCGYVVGEIRDDPPAILKGKKCIVMLGGAIALWIAEFLMLHIMKWNGHMSISLGIYPVVMMLLLTALEYPLPSFGSICDKCRVLAGFTYYAHPLMIWFLDRLFTQHFGILLQGIPMFLAVVILTFAGGMLIWKCSNRYLNYLV